MFKSSRSFSTVNAERLEKNELYQYEHVIRSSMTKTNHDNSNIKVCLLTLKKIEIAFDLVANNDNTKFTNSKKVKSCIVLIF